MKIAAHVLAYNVNRFLKPVLENLEPHVDKIYIAHSERPFGYNKKSRQTRTNPTKISDVRSASSSSKIEIISGDWGLKKRCVTPALTWPRRKDLIGFLFRMRMNFIRNRPGNRSKGSCTKTRQTITLSRPGTRSGNRHTTSCPMLTEVLEHQCRFCVTLFF